MDEELLEKVVAPPSVETQDFRLQELAEWGVDLSLVQSSLSRTPTERINHMLELLQLAIALRHGYLRATHQSVTHEDMPS